MSQLFRSLPTVSEAPPPRPGPTALSSYPRRRSTSQDADTSSSSDSSVSTQDSITTLRPSESQQTFASPSIPWSEFFSTELFLPVELTPTQNALYHAYLTPPRDPSTGPLFVCLHGAGSSAMSFAPFAQQIKRLHSDAGVLSISAREHGSSITSTSDTEPAPVDFSRATLVSDALQTINAVVQRMSWPALPPSILVGHSLGGVVATQIAAQGALGARLIGFQVLDVVEGSAVEALAFMKTYLASRPARFASVDEAVDWVVRSRMVRDAESARITTPLLLVREEDGEGWCWRTDVKRTQPWWGEWFAGLSGDFLRGRAAKGLVLAGTDRLDRELMVGQMQGKFQLTVIPESGHFIQEDVPEKMANLALEFFRRNDRSTMVLPPKVSDLLAQGKKV